MNKHLFLFTIGPVQSFIAHARKTQDLYTGSFLLSHLIDFAMKELKNEKKVINCKLIFPSENIESKPNRFIAEIESDDVKSVGGKLENFVKEEFENIAQNVLGSLSKKYDRGFEDSFLKQIKTHLQIYWVAIPLNNDYPQIYSELEKTIGAIKNVRVFKQLNNGEGRVGRKCSLCGERNVLFYKKTSSGKVPAYIQKDAIELKDEYKLNPGEGLCTVCFTKRFYKKNQSFPSTAEISLMDKIPEDDLNTFKNKKLDPQLFFEENLTKDYFKKFKIKIPLEEVKKLRKKILDKNNLKSKNLSKYYVLIMLDGDRMGKWLSGESLGEKEKIRLEDFHNKLSKALGDYADKVKKIIKEPRGKLVYAGGDDLLAFVNLNHLFDVLIDLRKEFPKFEELGFNIKNGCKSTASAGIVIAHYKTPLSEVLKWARKMEKKEAKAEEKGGRDAFAIAVLKHSGEIDKTVWKWNEDNENKSLRIELLKELVKELNDDKEGFSNTFIKNLNIEFQKLGEIENDMMLKVEIKRLLGRSSQIKGDKEKKKQKVQKWQGKLYNIYIDFKTKDNFLSLLNIADFITRKTK